MAWMPRSMDRSMVMHSMLRRREKIKTLKKKSITPGTSHSTQQESVNDAAAQLGRIIGNFARGGKVGSLKRGVSFFFDVEK